MNTGSFIFATLPYSQEESRVSSGSQDICLIAEGNIEEIKQEILDKGYPAELGPVKRTGALGAMNSIYLRDPDGNLIEIAVYEE